MLKKPCIATILAVLLSFSVAGMADAKDDRKLPKTKKPKRLIVPHPVTMEEWTEIIRSLKKEKERPVKPFRFRLKENNLIEL